MAWFFFSAIGLLAGFIHGLTGFGSVLVALPLLTLTLAPGHAVPLAALLGLAINITLAAELRRGVHRADVLLPLLAAAPGVLLGIAALKNLAGGWMLMLLGVVILAFAAWQLAGAKPLGTPGRGWLAGAGFASGCLGGALGAHGPPIIITYACQGWPKKRFKATLSAYLLISGIVLVTLQATAGLMTNQVLGDFAASLPGLATGIFLGRAAFNRMGEHSFKRLVCIVLLVLGASLLLRGATG